MFCQPIIFIALLASSSVLNALPIPDPDNNCIGSSFSPTNCNSPNSGQVNAEPDVDVSPTVNLKERSEAELVPAIVDIEERDNNCIGSSFSPTNCNSPGSDQINAEPEIDVSPTINLALRKRADNDTVGSSFSPTNNGSPNSNQVNAKPKVKVDPTINARDAEPEPMAAPEAEAEAADPLPEVLLEERDGNCIGSSFSPTNCNSPGSNVVNLDPNVNVDPTVGL